jgi:hypothetical protein
MRGWHQAARMRANKRGRHALYEERAVSEQSPAMPTTINTPIYYIYIYICICIYISINIGIGERGVIVMARYYLSQRVLLMCAHVRCRQHAALSLSACFLSLSGCFLSLSLDACSL